MICLSYVAHIDYALSVHTIVFQNDPNHYDAFRTKGFCLLRTGRSAEALPCFEFALKPTPNDAGLLTWKGEALEALGKPAEAIAAFEAAIEADPANGDAWRGKGLLQVKQEHFPEDAAAVARATTARPRDKHLSHMRG